MYGKYLLFQKELFLLCFYKQIEKKNTLYRITWLWNTTLRWKCNYEIVFAARIRYPFLSKEFSIFVTKIAVLFFSLLQNTSVTFETENMNNEYWEMVFCYQNCSDLLWEKIVLVIEKIFEIRGWGPRICKNFEITRTICLNSEKSEQFLVAECFFNLFLEVSQI